MKSRFCKLFAIFALVGLQGWATVSAGNLERTCKKAEGRMETRANAETGNGITNVNSVHKCLNLLQNDLEPEQDCMEKKDGQCKCTSCTLSSDGSASNPDFYKTFTEFREARQKLWQDSVEFHSIDAERYHGNTHLTYSCIPPPPKPKAE